MPHRRPNPKDAERAALQAQLQGIRAEGQRADVAVERTQARSSALAGLITFLRERRQENHLGDDFQIVVDSPRSRRRPA